MNLSTNNGVTRLTVDKCTNVYFLLDKDIQNGSRIFWRLMCNGELVFVDRVPNFGFILEHDGVSRVFDTFYEALDYFDSLISHKYGVDLVTHA